MALALPSSEKGLYPTRRWSSQSRVKVLYNDTYSSCVTSSEVPLQRVTACWGASTCVAAFFLSCSLSETPKSPLSQTRTQAWLKNGLGCFRRRLSRNGAFGQSPSASSASVFHASFSVANTTLSTKRVKTMTVGHDDLNLKAPAHAHDVCTETRVEMTVVPLCRTMNTDTPPRAKRIEIV